MIISEDAMYTTRDDGSHDDDTGFDNLNDKSDRSKSKEDGADDSNSDDEEGEVEIMDYECQYILRFHFWRSQGLQDVWLNCIAF